jgi:hypothetical protein
VRQRRLSGTSLREPVTDVQTSRFGGVRLCQIRVRSGSPSSLTPDARLVRRARHRPVPTGPDKALPTQDRICKPEVACPRLACSITSPRPPRTAPRTARDRKTSTGRTNCIAAERVRQQGPGRQRSPVRLTVTIPRARTRRVGADARSAQFAVRGIALVTPRVAGEFGAAKRPIAGAVAAEFPTLSPCERRDSDGSCWPPVCCPTCAGARER